jgi:hypothetical protein
MDGLRRSALALALAGALGCEGVEGPGAVQPRFVAVGAGGAIASSFDGVMWAPESSGVAATLDSVAAGPTNVVAVGAGGTIVTSHDGSSWRTQDSHTTVDLRHVIFTGEKFVAVGGSWETGAVTVTSVDGFSWTLVESPASHMFHAVAHGRGTLVAASYYRSALLARALFTSELSATSSLASNWSERQGPDFYDSLTRDDQIMIVGEASVSVSTDGVTWTERPLPGPELVSGIAASDAVFVIVGELGTIYRSVNGTDWSRQGIPAAPPPALAFSLRDVAHGASRFVAVGIDGVIVSSFDGTAWVRQASGTSNHLSDVTYGPVSLAH